MMNVPGWEYYNHAIIPTTAPHEVPDMLPIMDKSIWRISGSFPLLARWTTDFDCGFETNWWYVIKDTPLVLEEIPSKERKSINQALKKCYVRMVRMTENVDLLYRVFIAAYKKYELAGIPMCFESFQEYCESNDAKYQCWGGYDIDSHIMIGYMVVHDCGDFAKILSAKFDPDYSRLQVSDALYYNVLTYYLNEEKKKYISSGERSINHITGTQEYKIRRFGYRKAYCKLHIEYNPKVKWLIRLCYLFRKVLIKFDNHRFFHLINSVLRMQEIACEGQNR